MERLTRCGCALGLGVLALGLAPSAATAAQAREGLSDRCLARAAGPCNEGALASEAIVGGLGLALAGGSQLPGSPSTLGRRVGRSPRWALAVRGGLVSFDHPDLAAGGEASGSEGSWVRTLQGEIALGVFDGFSLAPTMGGFLSLDLFGTVGLAAPSGDDFDGSLTAWGYGVRVGIIRESFTLPAITLSAARRHGSEVSYGAPLSGGVSVEDLTVTSLRGTVGKEFLALGLFGGVGWDRTQADGALWTGAGDAPGGTALDGLRAERVLFFGGLTRTWLVVQMTAEGGFATGFDERPEGSTGAYDPTGGTIFGSLSFRLIL